MPEFFALYTWFCLMGVGMGVLSGLLGIGGGLVLVPLLSTVFIDQGWTPELAFHTALGTSMACIVFTSLASLLAHHKHGNIVWSYVWAMVPMAFLGAFIATGLAIRLSAVYLTAFFALFTLSAAVQLFRDRTPASRQPPTRFEIAAVSCLIGVISALVSIGGGTLTVPYLSMRNVEIKKAIGTSAVLGFPIALASTLGYVYDALQTTHTLSAQMGFLYLPAIALITPISMMFAPQGVALNKRLPVKALKRVFALFLLAVTIKLLWAQLG